jgi:hypothetical protein
MKLSPGDLVEIETGHGLAYVQITHNHIAYPEVIRVIEGIYEIRPDSVELLARAPTVFTTMFPLGGALAGKRIAGSKIGAAEIPEKEKLFPTFKMPIRDKQGAIAYWWYWDGQSLKYDTATSPETDGFPLREVMTVENFLGKLG